MKVPFVFAKCLLLGISHIDCSLYPIARKKMSRGINYNNQKVNQHIILVDCPIDKRPLFEVHTSLGLLLIQSRKC